MAERVGFEPTVRLLSVQTISSRPRYDRFGTSPSLKDSKCAFLRQGEGDILSAYLLTGYRICCVVGHSKYREYAFAPSALHLRHPASRYRSSVYTMSA